MKSLIGKSVKIETVENTEYSGKVYVIDPVYKTIVLHCAKPNTNGEEKIETVYILFHALKRLEILSDAIDDNYLKTNNIPVQTSGLSNEQLRIKLKRWLKHMFINVDECGDYLKIDNHLLIVPPYGLDNCICNNTIILERIRNIIGLMPSDFS